MAPKTVDPKKVIITFFGRNITGFADGEFIKVEGGEDEYKTVVGADGEVARVRNNDDHAEVTITLLQTSPSNADMDKIRLAGKLTGLDFAPFSMTDLNGGDLVAGAEAWISKKPAVSFSKGVETRVWVLTVAKAVFKYGVW